MNKKVFKLLLFIFVIVLPYIGIGQSKKEIKENIPLDSIRLSDPFILADKASKMYYMTGTGGKLWSSKDLQLWSGPYDVVKIDTASWMGPKPMIWAAEIHRYKNKYYYFATFTNSAIKITDENGKINERRACHILVGDRAEGPYLPMQEPVYLPANKSTLDGTFWVDKNNKPYLIYCHEWVQNDDGTVEKIELKPDLSGTTGNSKILFKASSSPWSREEHPAFKDQPNKVTDGPYVFRTQTGKLGMIWTSWIYNVYTQGAAYSQSGTIDGPWIQEKDPITPPNYGHGMIFKSFEGQPFMVLHSHKDNNGNYIRIPKLFKIDLSKDKMTVQVP